MDPAVYGGGNTVGAGTRFDPAVMTVQFFRDFYQYDASHVRTQDYNRNIEAPEARICGREPDCWRQGCE